MRIIMSHILYSSIARAGGIDLFLGIEAVSHPPLHPRKRRHGGPSRMESFSLPALYSVRSRTKRRGGLLRRRAGQELIRLGGLITGWGRSWTAQAKSGHSCTALRAVQ